MHNAIKGLFLALALGACATTPDINVTPNAPDVVIARPTAPAIHEPGFTVVNRENFEQLRTLVNSGEIIIVMTREEFNALLENNQQIIVYFANTNSVLNQYESRITGTNSPQE